MNLIAGVIRKLERTPIPDGLTITGIDRLRGHGARRIGQSDSVTEMGFDHEDPADWLTNCDANMGSVDSIPRDVYGPDAKPCRRWRPFFLATAGLLGHAGGAEWGVGPYRLASVAG